MISKKKRLWFTVVLVLLNLALVYLLVAAFRTLKVYSYLKSEKLGWNGRVLQADPELGLANVPGAIGEQTEPVGSNVPVRIDEHGFRIPASGSMPDRRPLILALGCSFTFGSSCLAEETYPYVLAAKLHGSAINSAVCSHGLAQMLLLAQRLVPEYKPDIVLAQYSPWIVDRAMRPFSPTYFGIVPTPYFARDAAGALTIQPPAFPAVAFDLPAANYRYTRRSFRDLASFFWHVGLPLFTYEDAHMAAYRIKLLLGRVPPPVKEDDADSVAQFVYNGIADVCRKSGSRMLIVIIGKDQQPVKGPSALYDVGVPVVNAHDKLRARLPEQTEESFNQCYAHWRGTPPRIVDSHPNPLAQSLIADAVNDALKHPQPGK